MKVFQWVSDRLETIIPYYLLGCLVLGIGLIIYGLSVQ